MLNKETMIRKTKELEKRKKITELFYGSRGLSFVKEEPVTENYKTLVCREFWYPEMQKKEDLKEMIHFPCTFENMFDQENFFDWIWKNVPRELLMSCPLIYFVWDEKDLECLYEETGDEYALFVLENEDLIGIMWFDKGIPIINLKKIMEITVEDLFDCDFRYDVERGILETLMHELYHLDSDCNIFSENYKQLGEDDVEEKCRTFYLEHPVEKSIFSDMFSLSCALEMLNSCD